MERVHDRLDEVLTSVGAVAIDVAVIRAENAAVKTAVAALTAGQADHDKRITAIEHDRSKLSGLLVGVGAVSASGSLGLGAVLRLMGLLP
jgi:hypothetical protein